jgi:hypothetical protein
LFLDILGSFHLNFCRPWLYNHILAALRCDIQVAFRFPLDNLTKDPYDVATWHMFCHNLNLGLVTKAKVDKGVGQEWSLGVTSHAPRSVGKCEGMNPTLPSEFDSRPLKVRNRPSLLPCKWCATYCWKPLDEGYNFSLNFTLIEVYTQSYGPLKSQCGDHKYRCENYYFKVRIWSIEHREEDN